jgi:RES domain-containing protein
MDVYRITLTQYASSLVAPGSQGRWNNYGSKVIYTAASRSLACLENLVHRDGEGLKELFSVIVIELPDDITTKEVLISDLGYDWTNYMKQPLTRRIGDAWLQSFESCVLKVPSSIVQNEYNYLINPAHPQFKKIRIKATEDFLFDARLIPASPVKTNN